MNSEGLELFIPQSRPLRLSYLKPLTLPAVINHIKRHSQDPSSSLEKPLSSQANR